MDSGGFVDIKKVEKVAKKKKGIARFRNKNYKN